MMKENNRNHLKALSMKRHRSAGPHYTHQVRPITMDTRDIRVTRTEIAPPHDIKSYNDTKVVENRQMTNFTTSISASDLNLKIEDMKSSKEINEIKTNSKIIDIGENPFHVMNQISIDDDDDTSFLIKNEQSIENFNYINDFDLTPMKIEDDKSTIITNGLFEIDQYVTPQINIHNRYKDTKEEDLDLIKKENRILNLEYQKVKDNLESAYLQIEELNLNVTHLKKKISLMEGDLVDEREKGICCLNELNEYQENLKQMKTEMKEYENQNELLKKQMNLKEMEIVNLREVSKKEKCDVDALKEEILRLKDENFENDKELKKNENLRSEEIKLKSTLEALKKENERLKMEKYMDTTVHKMNVENEKLKEEIGKYMSTVNKMSVENEALKKELTNEKNDHTSVMEYCSKMENEYESMKRELFNLQQQLSYHQEKLKTDEKSIRPQNTVIPDKKRFKYMNTQFKNGQEMDTSQDLSDILIDLNNRKNHLEAEYVKLPSRSGRSQQERNRKYIIENELETILSEMGSIRLKLKKNTESTKTSLNLKNES